jgi:hypothetical protein
MKRKIYKKGCLLMAKTMVSLLVEDEADVEEQAKNSKYMPPYLQMRPGDIAMLVNFDEHQGPYVSRIKFYILFNEKTGVVSFSGKSKDQAEAVLHGTYDVISKKQAEQWSK